jgi:hypothetical protein
LLFFTLCVGVLAGGQTTYRVLVSTDLGGDPDDIQSLYRLAHYSDILKVEGIVSSPGPGAKNSAAKIREWLLRIDIETMRRGHRELTDEASLVGALRQGAYHPGAPSKARVTEGSKFIIERAHAPDPEGKGRVLWILVWGSLTDVAQAIHDDPAIVPKIRIYYIGSSNTRADLASRDYLFEGLKSKWPHLWWIENGTLPLRAHDTFRGVYLGGDQSGEWHNEEFVKRNIRGRGSDHGGEFDEIAGDAFPLAGPGPQGSILKEGDSPSMLYLLSPVLGGVGNVDNPAAESWGGRFRAYDKAAFPNFYVDLPLPEEEVRTSVNKWRVAYLSDWKKRWQWYGEPRLAPLKVSVDGRRLVTEPGEPFVWVGDTAWHLFINLNREEAEQYLLDRRRKKFTVIQAHILGFAAGDRNAYGETAFTSLDPLEPNEKYFQHADWIIRRAEGLGLRILLLPAWARMHVEGTTPLFREAGAAARYGRWLGERYRNASNLLWCLGGDVRPTRHEVNDALAGGIAAGLGRDPLMTYHPPGGTYRPPATSTGEFYHDKPWLDFNMIQSGHRRGNENYLRIAEDYERLPVKPTLDSEPCYEQHPIIHNFENGAFEAFDVRQRAWWSILAGAFGFTYGANGIWQMAKPDRPARPSHDNFHWDAALDYEGARQMRLVHEILYLYPVRVPDQSILVTPAGSGNERLQCARAEDSSYWLIYDTNGRDFELKLPWAAGKAMWFNPRNGKRTRAEWQARFDPPGNPGIGNDWLLILERGAVLPQR